ncbi:MAG: SDR family NAD(P)-dependent oxidoreductase [Sulfurovum sp.]|nr:SDR family NAD(P)-dependent oxidoreductase [Sulfurovum sp.]
MQKQPVIVITGCSTGIGLETARYLKDRFIVVYPTARDVNDVQMLRELGFDNALELDVRDASQIASVIQSVLDSEGRIDTWFNNAGYGQVGAIEDIGTEVLKEQFETNVFGLHECTRQIIPIMREQGFGKIIQHSSVLGITSLFGRGAYNASKYAVEGLTDTLRLELHDTDIYPILLNTGPVTSNFRETAVKMLQKNVDIVSSHFAERYRANIEGDAKKVPFNEEAEAVASVVHKIILDPHPSPRYYITKATYILGYAKRILSTSWLDRLLLKIG